MYGGTQKSHHHTTIVAAAAAAVAVAAAAAVAASNHLTIRPKHCTVFNVSKQNLQKPRIF